MFPSPPDAYPTKTHSSASTVVVPQNPPTNVFFTPVEESLPAAYPTATFPTVPSTFKVLNAVVPTAVL